VWDTATGEVLLSLKERCFILSSTCSNDGVYIVTTNSQKGGVKFWDPKDGDLQMELLGHQTQVTSADFSPDDQLLLTAGLDGGKIWKLYTEITLSEELGDGEK
jgi:WD40 repeat protein